jgi:hypothetical protein
MTEVHWLWCVEEMRNTSQVQQHIEKSQWLAHLKALQSFLQLSSRIFSDSWSYHFLRSYTTEDFFSILLPKYGPSYP